MFVVNFLMAFLPIFMAAVLTSGVEHWFEFIPPMIGVSMMLPLMRCDRGEFIDSPFAILLKAEILGFFTYVVVAGAARFIFSGSAAFDAVWLLGVITCAWIFGGWLSAIFYRTDLFGR